MSNLNQDNNKNEYQQFKKFCKNKTPDQKSKNLATAFDKAVQKHDKETVERLLKTKGTGWLKDLFG
jgi:thiaminase